MFSVLAVFILVVLIGFIIILPVYVNVFKEQIYDYIKEQLKLDARDEKLRKQMLKKKNN